MATFSFTDIADHNAHENVVLYGDTFTFAGRDRNDTFTVSGHGDVSGTLGLGNDFFSAANLYDGNVSVHA